MKHTEMRLAADSRIYGTRVSFVLRLYRLDAAH